VEIKRGIGVSPGVAIGAAVVIEREGAGIGRTFVMPDEVEPEMERFDEALARSRAEIEALSEKLRKSLSDLENISDIFEMHRRILDDPRLRSQVEALVRNRHFTAEYALSQVMRRYVKSLESAGDSYLLQRVRDFDDLEQRLLRNLRGGQKEEIGHAGKQVVVVAHDLMPSQTVSFDRDRVLAMAIEAGGRTSHTAIIARALRIPAVVGVGEICNAISDGDRVIVDGTGGIVILDPDDVTLRRYQARARSLQVIEEKIAAEFCNLPAVTRDGRRVSVEANIEFPQEVAAILQYGAEGVGLYRTEFLFHAAERPPGEEEHFQAYMDAIRALGDHPITIRVLDLGADKFDLGYQERNPFLGCRSMRLMRARPEIFRQQIKAILRASAFGRVRFMFPLISTLPELREAMAMVNEVKAELDGARIRYDKDIRVGIMIEVPSAAIMAETFAREVDFFSIGTNDLVQYTLAVDRDNEHVAHLFSPVDPAVLRLMRMTLEAAQKAGIDLSICGEMAGDILYTVLLVGMGFQRLSMAPTAVADVKKLVCSVSYEDARRVAEEAMQMSSATEIEEYLRGVTRRFIPELVGD